MTMWVQTKSGVAFDLLEPRSEGVQFADVAHHLARINRYSGATIGATGYSVAQHSVLVADVLELWGADARLQLEGLLHDAGETYYGDITAPVIRALAHLGAGDALRSLRARIDTVVRDALGLAPEEPPLVKRADLVALAIERKFVMAPCERDWRLPELADTRWDRLIPLSADSAEWSFIDRWQRLNRALEAACGS